MEYVCFNLFQPKVIQSKGESRISNNNVEANNNMFLDAYEPPAYFETKSLNEY